MLFDVHRRWPRAYIHRHKKHIRPPGFTAEGEFEMYNLLNQVNDMVIGEVPSSVELEVLSSEGVRKIKFPKKQIYTQHPHITADNHFSGKSVLDYAGRMGAGMTVTTRRDRYPVLELKTYVHHEKLSAGKTLNQRARHARYDNPIVAIRQAQAIPAAPTPNDNMPLRSNDRELGRREGKAYTQTLVSFQSTGATNISGVNNLPSAQLYVTTKSRGRGDEKRTWGIEQNEGRQTYLGHYFAVDNVDHMIKIAMIRFITWKYWHAPYLHCLSIAVIAAYDMYLEIAEGHLDQEWKVETPMTFNKFRKELSIRMLSYDPRNNVYPGDEGFRNYTQQPKARRGGANKKRKAEDEPAYDRTSGVDVDNLNIAMKSKRLCGNLDKLQSHAASCRNYNNAGPCEVCGKATKFICGMCNKHVCLFDKRQWKGSCFVNMHNDSFFGLTKCDHEHLKKKGKWKAPDVVAIRRNTKHIKTLKTIMEVEEETEGSV